MAKITIEEADLKRIMADWAAEEPIFANALDAQEQQLAANRGAAVEPLDVIRRRMANAWAESFLGYLNGRT